MLTLDVRIIMSSDLLTCFSNDFGYENWVQKAIEFYADKDDILILISSSGNSQNMINAAHHAKKFGIKSIITFTGNKDGNKLQKMGDLNFWVNSSSYNHIENVHQILLLSIVDLISGKREQFKPELIFMNSIDNLSIDIILPNYNKGEYIDECILSILNQSFLNWKLYIIDDCSTDNSLKKNKYKDYKKIQILKLKKNKGPSFCRNLGMRLSKNSYISFIDSDDYWTKDKLKNQLEFMKISNYGFTFTDYVPFSDKK